MTARLDTISYTFHVTQKINYKNQYANPIDKLILNDWNHAYSNRKTNLGKRFSDQYVRNFHLSTEKERGNTKINQLTINNAPAQWQRIENQIDLVELKINTLQPNDSIQIKIDYEIKIPDAKFTRWGKVKENFYLKDSFLALAKIKNGSSVQYSNEDIEDAVLEDIESITVAFKMPSSYTITSNLKETEVNTFNGSSKENQFAIEKKSSFESFKNDKIEIETNLTNLRVNEFQRAIVIDKIINYIDSNLGKSKVDKIMVSQIDYDRNPFYGLNQLPAFLSPFPDSFLYELKFLKVYSQNYLKQNLNIDFRKDHYLFSGIQTYLLMNYIEENYPDLRLIGNLSRFKITNGYQLASAKFNDQYQLAYLLMARKNLDQRLDESKEKLVKFNEQIASKYKTGLAFKFLDNYIGNDLLKKSIKEFVEINNYKYTEKQDFRKILVSNSSKDINWFFDEMIHSNIAIDYSFGAITKESETSQVEIKNKTNSHVPYLVSGFKNRQKVFEKWIDNPQKDSIITINNTEVDKLIINNNNFFTEINNRNNHRKLKKFLWFNKPVKFTFLRDVENANYSQIFYVPEIGYNKYDGAILTLSLHNKNLINKPLVFDFSPSYSTTPRKATGSFGLSYNHQRSNKKLHSIRYSFGSSYFHYYENAAYFKATPAISLNFRDSDLTKNIGKTLYIKQNYVNKQSSPLLVNDKIPLQFSATTIGFSSGQSETAKSFGYSLSTTFAGQFSKFTSEIGYSKLFENNYQFSLRLFAGTFIQNKQKDLYAFGLDKPQDLLFDYNLYGRSESTGLFSQQLVIAEGGFKSTLNNPYANEWMTTLNATSSVWKWIQLYGDVGLYKNNTQSAQFVYDSGMHFNLVPGYFELFFPVYSSKGFELSQDNYHEKIRFIVTINPNTLIKLFTRKWF
ncbi:aminopeptidase [Flavobacterium amnicola]|uniref:Aminopeptidase n=1 Tax=Flavobacterium amnicola TaxID=2506422 RepID=A0A4Q1K496_9FLAO|nr:aminopeptidase [Flavobacterium amnicola]